MSARSGAPNRTINRRGPCTRAGPLNADLVEDGVRRGAIITASASPIGTTTDAQKGSPNYEAGGHSRGRGRPPATFDATNGPTERPRRIAAAAHANLPVPSRFPDELQKRAGQFRRAPRSKRTRFTTRDVPLVVAKASRTTLGTGGLHGLIGTATRPQPWPMTVERPRVTTSAASRGAAGLTLASGRHNSTPRRGARNVRLSRRADAKIEGLRPFLAGQNNERFFLRAAHTKNRPTATLSDQKAVEIATQRTRPTPARGLALRRDLEAKALCSVRAFG